MPRDPELDAVLSEFAARVAAIADDRATKRIQARLAPLMQAESGRLGAGGAAGAVRLGTGNGFGHTVGVLRPRQTCPVPGCQNTAAPRYGMACVMHKDLPKGELKKYREARKAEKKAAMRPPAPPMLPPRKNRRATIPAR